MITVYIGENTEARDKAVKSHIAKFANTYGDMAIDYIEVEDADFTAIIDAITTVPFLSNKRMVVIRYLSASKEFADKFQDIAKRTPDSTDLIIIESRLDKRSIYNRLLHKLADELKTFDNLDGNDLANWLVEFTSEIGATITKEDAHYLIDRVGLHQQQLSNDIKKLALVELVITKDVIDEMTELSPHSSVFAMLDNLMQGKIDLACRLYEEQRSMGVEPQAIMGMIVWQLNIISIAVTAGPDISSEELAKKFKLNPFVMRKNMAIANKISKQKMIALLDDAIEADKNIKTNKTKPDNEVYALLLQIAVILSNQK